MASSVEISSFQSKSESLTVRMMAARSINCTASVKPAAEALALEVTRVQREKTAAPGAGDLEVEDNSAMAIILRV